MLEIERQNRESTDGPIGTGGGVGPIGASSTGSSVNGPGSAGSGSAGSAESESANGGQGRGLLRRARRAVTRPAGPPAAAGSPEAEPPAAGSTAPQAAPRQESAAGGDAAPATDAQASEPRKRPTRSRTASTAKEDAAGKPETAVQEGQDGERQGTASARTSAARRSGSGRGRRAGQSDAAESDAAQHDAAQHDAGQHDAAQRDAGRPADQTDAPATSAAPPAAFQPPLVIFQPPEITAARAPAAQKPQRQQPASTAARDGDDEGEDGLDSREEGAPGSASRRRRRGGRGRGSARARDGAADGADAGSSSAADDQIEQDQAADDADDIDEDGAPGTPGTAKRRRRRRRSGSGGDVESAAPSVAADDPPNTVVHVRTPREKNADVTDVKGVKGSTRLEAKRQRRREGRESGRRRPPIITESEFLARREAVERVMVVRQHDDRTQIAVLEDGVLVEHYVDKASHQSYVGNVYLGKVQNVLPSMEAAFVDIGKGRNAVLYAGEVNFDASGLEGESKRIESALKSGQSILVQVTKDPIGHKGARLTSQASLPGRYLVYVPGASMTGISRKLPDTERTRLKQILKQIMPENAGVIVRTAAEGASEEELSRDVARLSAQWEAIEKKAKTAAAPDLLYSEPDLTLRVVRDIFNEDFSNLVIASDSEWDLVDEYVRYVAPHLADRMQRWDDSEDVFGAYRIDEQLAKALERKVWLPSGGSLVIDHTEAMTVIDVNTGKFTGQGGNLEQTVTRNNLEAAEEIVRQLRLRDLGGIIVIDFIDMVLESNRELVLRRLLECLARDRTKHQVAEVTSLGLVQMTRKRVGSGLLEAFSVPCEHCNGRGVLISLEPVDHSHGRDSGRGGQQKEDDSSRNGAARGGGGQDSGGRSSRSRSASSRRAGSSGDNDETGKARAGGESAPTPAPAPKPRGPRSRASRSAGPPDPALADGSGSGGAPEVQHSGGDAGAAASAATASAAAVPGATDGAGPSAQGADGQAAASASRAGRTRSSRGRRSSQQTPDAEGSEGAAEPANS
jgi:ribonuclease E